MFLLHSAEELFRWGGLVKKSIDSIPLIAALPVVVGMTMHLACFNLSDRLGWKKPPKYLFIQSWL